MQQFRLGASRTESIFAEKVVGVLLKKVVQREPLYSALHEQESSWQVEGSNVSSLLSTFKSACGVLCPF